MKKISLGLVMVSLLTATFFAQATDDLEAIKLAGIIKIGTEGTYAPYTYHDKEGKLVGFDVDIARAVAEKIGVKPEFIEGRWDGLIAGLDVRRYDTVANQVGITPERQTKFDFSNPYIIPKTVLIVHSDNQTIKGFTDLKDQKSAQSLTSNYARIATEYGAQLTPTEGFNQSLELVLNGRVAATINDNLSFLDFQKHKPNAKVKIAATTEQVEGSALVVRKNQPELVKALNKALDDIKADGTYQTISVRYFGQDVSQ